MALWTTRGIVALQAAFVVLALLAAARLPVIPDEAYYWTWSRQLALSYVDHPPGVAFLLAAATKLWGDGLLGLRFFSVACLFGTLVVSAAAARRLGGSQAAELAVVVLLGAPMLAVGYIPGTHDPLQGFVTALSAYALVRALEEGSAAGWSVTAGLLFAGAAIIKHTSALLALGVLLGLLASRHGRSALARPAPWLGAALGVAGLLPWLWSELSLGGGSFRFQAVRVFFSRPARGWIALPLMLGSMLLTLGPLSVLALFWAPGRARADGRPAVFALTVGGMPLLLGCVAAVWAGGGEANWPLPALVLAVPAIATMAFTHPPWARWLYRAGAVTLLASLVLLLHASIGVLPLPLAKDPLRRGEGFDRLAAQVAAVAEQHAARLLASRRYQHASLLRYHLRDRWPVLELGSPRGRPSQYDRWERQEVCTGDVVVVVTDDPSPPPELELLALGAPVVFDRGEEGGQRFWITAYRALADRGSCASRRLNVKTGAHGGAST